MNLIDNQVEYWDSVAGEKTFRHPLNGKLFREHVSFEHRILDYGCGYGRVCEELRERGFRNVVGVDPSPRMIERGRRENPRVRLCLLPKAALPFRNESFDATLLFAVLTCVPTDEGQRRIIGDIERVLRPGGLLYISDVPLQRDERNRRRYREHAGRFGTYGTFRLPEGVVLRHQDLQTIESLTSGFETITMEEIDVTTMNDNPAKAFQYFGRKRAK